MLQILLSAYSHLLSDSYESAEQTAEDIESSISDVAASVLGAASTLATATAGSAIALVHAGQAAINAARPYYELASAASRANDIGNTVNTVLSKKKSDSIPEDFEPILNLADSEGPLVGIETNPGPPKVNKVKSSKKKSQQRLQSSRRGMALVQRAISTGASVPAAATFRPGLFHSYGTASHEGRTGLKITGCHRIGDIITAGTIAEATLGNLAPDAVFQGNPSYSFQINPSHLGQPLSNIARGYLQFRCTSFGLVYAPSASTNTSGSLVFAYDPDGSTNNVQTLATYSSLESSMMFAPWERQMLDVSRYVDKSLKYVNVVSATSGTYDYLNESRIASAGRVGVFGASIFVNGNNPGPNLTTGSVYVCYTFELYGLGNRLALADPVPRPNTTEDINYINVDGTNINRTQPSQQSSGFFRR